MISQYARNIGRIRVAGLSEVAWIGKIAQMNSIPNRVSDRELERRWKLVRKTMAREKLDLLVCSGGYPSGYIRWLSNRWSRKGEPEVGSIVAFPLEGDMIYATHGDAVHRKPTDSYGVKEIVSSAQPNLLVNTQAKILVDALRSKRFERIGFLGTGLISAATYLTLVKGMPESEFVDATDLIAPIKAVKSDEELLFMNRAAEMHDAAVEVLRASVKPGKTGDDIIREVTQAVCLEGSESQLVWGSSAPPGTVCKYSGPSSREIKEGDQFAMLIECSEACGYYNEVMPIVCVGRVPKELEIAFDTAIEAQKILVNMARPGADPNEMLKASNKFLVESGYPPEGRLAGHSQGYDLVERPALSPLGENIRLEAGMVLALHPITHGDKAWGFPLVQDYLITDTGAKALRARPQEIIKV